MYINHKARYIRHSGTVGQSRMSRWRHPVTTDNTNLFFEHPIINSPYAYPGKHWELDEFGQPTQKIIGSRRRASFFTPIPQPKKLRGNPGQRRM